MKNLLVIVTVVCLSDPVLSTAQDTKWGIATITSTDFKKTSDCYPKAPCEILRTGQSFQVVGYGSDRNGSNPVIMLKPPEGESKMIVSISPTFVSLNVATNSRTVLPKEEMPRIEPEADDASPIRIISR